MSRNLARVLLLANTRFASRKADRSQANSRSIDGGAKMEKIMPGEASKTETLRRVLMTQARRLRRN